MSVLISRKTQRLYVRQPFQSVLESPVTIENADRPIGTHIFTAGERMGDGNLQRNMVTLDGGHPPGGAVKSQAAGGNDREVEPLLTDAISAKCALNKIVIPRTTLVVSPGSQRDLP